VTERIKLVQGDALPNVRLTLSDALSASAIDLSDPDTVVRVYFRAQGDAQVLATITCEKLAGGATGEVRFNFAAGVLNIEPGAYEAEIEIDFGGLTHTVYEPLKFSVRAQFA